MRQQSIANQIALITGASAGIGEATARSLAASGVHIVACARRIERVQQLCNELAAEHGVRTLPLELDVRDRRAVADTLGHLPAEFSAIDILVNNAGLALGLDPLQDGDVDDWDGMIDTNVKGLLYVTKAIVPGMIDRQRGHVVNIGSIAGQAAYPNGGVYCASKSAVRFISDGLRIDTVHTPLRITNIEPGMAETEFSTVRFHGDHERAAQVYANVEPLVAEDIADTIEFALTRPAHVQIQNLLVTCTQQATGAITHRST